MANENESSTNMQVWMQKYGWHLCKVLTKIPPDKWEKWPSEIDIWAAWKPNNSWFPEEEFWSSFTLNLVHANAAGTLQRGGILSSQQEVQMFKGSLTPSTSLSSLLATLANTSGAATLQGNPTKAFFKLWEETILLFVLGQNNGYCLKRGISVRRGRFLLWESNVWHLMLSFHCTAPVQLATTAPFTRPCGTSGDPERQKMYEVLQ